MRNKLIKLFASDGFVIFSGLIVAPLLSIILLSLSPENPLFTSISRMIWVNNLWLVTFIWAAVLMSIIAILTYRMAKTGSLEGKKRKRFMKWQLLCIILVFVASLIFPAKDGVEKVRFVNYVHDYLTVAAWLMYVIGLIGYSFNTLKKDRFLGELGLGLLGFTVISSIFFLMRVIDPNSYVGASAVSEIYIINNLLIYLVVMCVAQKERMSSQREQVIGEAAPEPKKTDVPSDCSGESVKSLGIE